MTQPITGPGIGLPPPQNLYPSYLTNTPYDAPTNRLGLAPGDAVLIPATSNYFICNVGDVSVLQWLDPVTGTWRGSAGVRGQDFIIGNMSYTSRIANLTGCVVGAIVAGGGSGFTQATATITANVGGSTWQPVVGGALSVSTVSTVGANYTMPPLVMIPVPASPGVPATAHATIASGTVASVVLDNVGAGYTSAPTVVLEPNPTDPNVGTITQATVVMVLNAALSGAITAALCMNNGASLATISALTLTAAGGAGTGATITPVVMQTATGTSIVAGGAGWGNAAAPAEIFSNGGLPTSVSAITNPLVELTGYRPRLARAVGVCNAGGTITSVTVTDPGLFVFAPTAAIAPGGTVPTTAASVTWTMGGLNDTILLQPL